MSRGKKSDYDTFIEKLTSKDKNKHEEHWNEFLDDFIIHEALIELKKENNPNITESRRTEALIELKKENNPNITESRRTKENLKNNTPENRLFSKVADDNRWEIECERILESAKSFKEGLKRQKSSIDSDLSNEKKSIKEITDENTFLDKCLEYFEIKSEINEKMNELEKAKAGEGIFDTLIYYSGFGGESKRLNLENEIRNLEEKLSNTGVSKESLIEMKLRDIDLNADKHEGTFQIKLLKEQNDVVIESLTNKISSEMGKFESINQKIGLMDQVIEKAEGIKNSQNMIHESALNHDNENSGKKLGGDKFR